MKRRKIMKVICGGRYIHKWKEESSLLRTVAVLYYLKPLDLEAIKKAISAYNEKHGIIENIDDAAAKTLHITGGHPGLMANYIPKEPKPKEHDLKNINEFISNITRGCKEQNVVKLLKNLCVFRKYDDVVLEKIKGTDFFKIDGQEIEIELLNNVNNETVIRDALVQTHLVENNSDTQFIEDNIVRRLFFIQLRKERESEFLKLCKIARDIYHDYLYEMATPIEGSSSKNTHVVFFELLYQELQYAYYKENLSALEFRPNAYGEFFNKNGILENSLEIFLRCPNIHDNLQILKDILKKLCSDWEFEFAVNFFLRTDEHYKDQPYSELLRKINDRIDPLQKSPVVGKTCLSVP